MRRRFDIEEEDWTAVEDDESDPPLVTRTYLECFWIDRDYCVQTVSDHDDAVVGYSITTRNRRFRPVIHFPLPPTGRQQLIQVLTLGRRRSYELARVKLGHTTFADSFRNEWGFPEIRSFLGARAWSYTELRYCGNPGHYQTVGLTMSSAAPTIGSDPARIETVDAGDDPWHDSDEAPDAWIDGAPDWIRAMHTRGIVTTVTIMLSFPAKDWRTFGPHGDEIRTIP